jgi:hypothetical protein
MNIVIDSGGLVLMWSEDGAPTPPSGGELVTLTVEQADQFRALPANGGITFDGKTFTALPVPPPPVPVEVTPLQIRRALRQMGVLDQVNAYVSTQGEDVQDAWQFAIAIPRNDPMVVAAAAALNIDADALFKLANTLP